LEILPPQFLQSLFDGSHEKCNNFFTFASFNANLLNFQNRRPGPYCFKIQGQIYYQINIAAQNENPTYGQLFIIDVNEVIKYSLTENSEFDLEIVQNVERIIRHIT